MADRDEIVQHVNAYMGLFAYDDYGPMGMQYIGSKNVNRIATAVSVTAKVIEYAGMGDNDMLITHHGLFWNNEPRRIDPRLEQRLSLLEEWDISLLSYHLCLDAHPEIGNNILTAKALGVKNAEPFAEIGWGGKTESGTGIIQDVLTLYSGETVNIFEGESRPVESLAVMTGKGGNYIYDAVEQGYDMFVTGEAEEPTAALAKELGIVFVAAGHYASEKIGVQALGAYIQDKFDVAHEFINIPNPI